MILYVVSTGSKDGNCYLLKSDTGEMLMLDMGCKKDWILRAADFRVSDIVAGLLTHCHSDHYRSADWAVRNGIPVYTTPELAIENKSLTGLSERKLKRIGNWKIIPFYVPHTTRDKETNEIIPCPNYGYLIEHPEMGKALYMTDLEYCPYSFKNQSVRHLIIESNYIEDMADKDAENYSHRVQGHCSLETCKGIVEANKTDSLETVTLIHMSLSAADSRTMLKEVQEAAGVGVRVEVAKRFSEIKLGALRVLENGA